MKSAESEKRIKSERESDNKSDQNEQASDSSLSVKSKHGKTATAQSKKKKKNTTKRSRVTYRKGFYYEKIGKKVLNRIKGISYPKDASNCRVSIGDLRYCRVKYVDFNGETQSGELICSKKIADDVMEIFSELYDNGYEIESIRLIDDFDGDDETSMEADNTSCFNYRPIAGSSKLSNHSLGLAIDINFKKQRQKFSGWTAQIIEHECDHLQGIII